MAYPGTISQSIGAPSGNATLRERDPNCIENLLKQIEVNLSEAVNSAGNLADKIRGEPSVNGGQSPTPTPSDVHGRLEQVSNLVTFLNVQLTRAHNAISG